MHKRRLNELRMQLVIEPAGPILIKSGTEYGADPTLPQMNFVRTKHPRTGADTIYLPGSSLKGVIRSHSERILNTVFADDPDAVCNPLDNRSHCARKIWNAEKNDGRKFTMAEQYRRLCRACRLYGHMVNGSHFASADAYPLHPIDNLPKRQNVAIDRFSGGVAIGPFDMEVALEGKFQTHLAITNFEIWQIGLLALTLRDIAEGRVRIGFAKSRGLGEVTLAMTHLEISYPGQFGQNEYDFANTIYGVGELADDLVDEYGFVPHDTLRVDGGMTVVDGGWGRPTVEFGQRADNPSAWPDAEMAAHNDAVTAFLAQTVPAFGTLVTA